MQTIRHMRVSVVIPCYNAARFLRETLDSILAQTLPAAEIIVIDDGSTDDSAAIAESYGPPVRAIRQPNQGESVARNRGIDEAKGDWIAFLDADDLWYPEKLEKQMAVAAASPDIVCVHTNFRYIGLRTHQPPTEPEILRCQYDPGTLIRKALINTSTAVVKVDVPVRFPAWTQHSEDMIYFADVSFHGQIRYLDEPLAMYRHHQAQQTRIGPQRYIANYESRSKWWDSVRRKLDHDIYHSTKRGLLDDLVDICAIAKWQRDWDSYWLIRGYLSTKVELQTHPLVCERIYPRVLYRLRDVAQRITGL